MGRHSAPDDDGDATASAPVLSEQREAGSRPRPGRHSRGEARRQADDDRDPDTPSGGLDVIETMLAGGADTGPVPAVPAAPLTDEGSTARIQPIVDPVLDEPVPTAVTTVIPQVAAAEDHPAAPAAQAAEPAVAAEPATPATAPDDTSAEKAAAKAEKKAAAKAEKNAAKAAKADSRAAAKAEKGTARAEKGPAAPADGKLSDLAVLRADSAARARVIAAVVAPFLLYVLVLFVLDALDLRTTLIWIWVPLVTAGVVAGLILDLAHRAAAARAISARERDAD